MDDSERTVTPQPGDSFGSAPRDDTGRTIPPAVMLRFTAAEERLYPTALTDPDGYEHAITLVGVVADELRERCTDFDSVLAARADLIDRLPELAAEVGVESVRTPADTVVDAASALRCRELQARG